MTRAAAHAMPAPSASSTTAGWMVLALGDQQLALAQRDVRLIGLVSDLKLSAAGESPEVGWLQQKNGSSWPVYCFDEALQILNPAPAQQYPHPQDALWLIVRRAFFLLNARFLRI